MTQLLFATNNQHKLVEMQASIGHLLKIISLADAGINQDIPEPFDTLEENASEKTRVIHQLSGKDCFSEDTGLEVKALNGAPGVYSARYAGADTSADKNISKLLQELKGKTDRSARFRTVISLIWKGKEYWFEGTCEGVILPAPTGTTGFGYDPVFQPLGSDKSFAEMTLAEKSQYSHRARAAAKLVVFLQDQHQVPA